DAIDRETDRMRRSIDQVSFQRISDQLTKFKKDADDFTAAKIAYEVKRFTETVNEDADAIVRLREALDTVEPRLGRQTDSLDKLRDTTETVNIQVRAQVAEVERAAVAFAEKDRAQQESVASDRETGDSLRGVSERLLQAAEGEGLF